MGRGGGSIGLCHLFFRSGDLIRVSGMIGVRTYGRCVNILCCGVVGTPVVLVAPGVGFGVRELVLPLSAGAVAVSLLEPLPMLSLEDMVVSVGHF